MNPKIIPDAYTEYDDGRIGAVAARLANLEAKIGAADAGEIGKLYVFAGGDAKAQAKTIFEGGPLLQAIEEAFDAGSSTIYAWRIGGPGTRATLALTANSGVNDSILIEAAQEGPAGNDISIEVDDQYLLSLTAGVTVLDSVATPNKVLLKGQDGTTILSFILAANIAGSSVFSMLEGGGRSHWIAGLDSSDSDKPKLWYYDESNTLLPAETVDLSGLLLDWATGEAVTAIPFYFPGAPATIILFSASHWYVFDPADKAPTPGVNGAQRGSWADLGLPSADISGGSLDYNYSGVDDGPSGLWACDKTSLILHHFFFTGGSLANFSLDVSYDITAIVGANNLSGIFFDPFNEELYFNLVDGSGVLVTDRPVADLLTSDIKLVIPIGVAGDDCENSNIAFGIEDIQHGLAVIVTDTGAAIPIPITYPGTNCQALVDAINADGSLISADLLLETNTLDPVTPAVNLSGGAGGSGELTNGDYLDGLELTTGKSEISWIHLVGAQSTPLWTAAIVHCNQMLELHSSERFAILETPLFESTAAEGSAQYLSDLQTYVDSLIAMMETVADRNAVIFAGGGQFIDSDGNLYISPITASCGGTMAGLEVQKSLINKNVKNLIKLIPEFSPGQLQQLIQARVNAVRLKPGRGFIITHSLTGAASGSDYSRANDLRSVYYAGKAARDAAQPLVGEENDDEGQGLARLRSAMSRPLEVMRDGGQIDDFDLQIKSDSNDRLLGDVYCELGVQPLRAMEMIYTTVYLK